MKTKKKREQEGKDSRQRHRKKTQHQRHINIPNPPTPATTTTTTTISRDMKNEKKNARLTRRACPGFQTAYRGVWHSRVWVGGGAACIKHQRSMRDNKIQSDRGGKIIKTKSRKKRQKKKNEKKKKEKSSKTKTKLKKNKPYFSFPFSPVRSFAATGLYIL